MKTINQLAYEMKILENVMDDAIDMIENGEIRENVEYEISQILLNNWMDEMQDIADIFEWEIEEIKDEIVNQIMNGLDEQEYFE